MFHLWRSSVRPARGSPNRCRVRVGYVHTAISDKGMQVVGGMTEEGFAEKMRHWQKMVSGAMKR